MNWYLKVLKNYAVFSGRAQRAEFWYFTLINFIVVLVLEFLGKTGSILSMLYVLAIIIPSLAVTVRRLHDTNRTGWWIFISLIPFVGSIVLIIFEVLDGTPGVNNYGPNPKELSHSQPDGSETHDVNNVASEVEATKTEDVQENSEVQDNN